MTFGKRQQVDINSVGPGYKFSAAAAVVDPAARCHILQPGAGSRCLSRHPARYRRYYPADIAGRPTPGCNKYETHRQRALFQMMIVQQRSRHAAGNLHHVRPAAAHEQPQASSSATTRLMVFQASAGETDTDGYPTLAACGLLLARPKSSFACAAISRSSWPAATPPQCSAMALAWPC